MHSTVERTFRLLGLFCFCCSSEQEKQTKIVLAPTVMVSVPSTFPWNYFYLCIGTLYRSICAQQSPLLHNETTKHHVVPNALSNVGQSLVCSVHYVFRVELLWPSTLWSEHEPRTIYDTQSFTRAHLPIEWICVYLCPYASNHASVIIQWFVEPCRKKTQKK